MLSTHHLPPTLPGASLITNGLALRRDPLGFFRRLAEEAGDFAHYELNNGIVYFVHEPAMVREILSTQQDRFQKWAFHGSFYKIFGTGLVASEDDLHKRMQRTARPAFGQSRLPGYGERILQICAERQANWGDGEMLLSRELTLLTLDVVTQLLFGRALGSKAEAVVQASETLQRLSNRVGTSADDDRMFSEANARITAIARDLLASHDSAADDDLLGMLIAAHRGNEELVSETQIIEEIRTFILAGHVTTANAVAAAFLLLSQAPAALAALQAELARVLQGRPVTFDDVPGLHVCEMILLETLRLHSPVWILGREAREEVRIGDHFLPASAKIVICPWLLHRDARYFPEPAEFRPDRWRVKARAALPKGCFLPFSIGSRSCLGERFALLEGTLLLASIAQRWEFSGLTPPHDPGWTPQVIYWPTRGIRLHAHLRTA